MAEKVYRIIENLMQKSKILTSVAVQKKIIKAGFTRNLCASTKARLLLLLNKTPESGSAT